MLSGNRPQLLDHSYYDYEYRDNSAFSGAWPGRAVYEPIYSEGWDVINHVERERENVVFGPNS